MSTGYTMPVPRMRFFDADGAPLALGKLYAFQAGGTVTPQDTYSDQGLTTPNLNPVVLSPEGEATIYVPDTTLYCYQLTDADDVVQWTVDNVSVPSPTAGAAADPVPTGNISMYGAAAAPTGYILCDGSAVSRATYATLFGVIGTTYGTGDGVTTFNVPDLRGRFALGKATAGTGNALGASGGLIDHVHSGPSHTHDVAVPYTGWVESVNTPPDAGKLQVGGSGAGAEASVSQATGNQTVTSTAAGTGNTGTANPPFLVVNFIIKT